jgi:uncharacterized protein (TIGR02452 family)
MSVYTKGFSKKPNKDHISQRNIELIDDNRIVIDGLKKIRVDAAPSAELWDNVDKLDQRSNPKLGPCAVVVINGDTFEVAEGLAPALDKKKSLIGPTTGGVFTYPMLDSKGPRVTCLNMANAIKPGGGYLNGASAQEEDLCRRSTLYACLEKFKFPIPQNSMLYHRAVIITRNADYSMKPDGGNLRKDLPVVSVISAATVNKPALVRMNGKDMYAKQEDITTQVMVCQAILRVAAKNKHRKLVLGAIGCGAFYHPQEEAVRIWQDVLGRPEFRGWFENVTFAVLSRGTPTPGTPSYNFTAFRDGLEDLLVGERGAKLTQPRRKCVPALDVDVADEEISLPRSRATSRARSISRAPASVEPEETRRRPSRTRSSTRLREQSRTRAASGSRASPRRTLSASAGRGRSRQASGDVGEKTVVYKFLVLVLVSAIAYLVLHFAEFCWFMVRRAMKKQRGPMSGVGVMETIEEILL